MSLKDYRPMMERCSNCLSCKWIPFDKVQSMRFGENCPSVCYNNFNTYSAKGRFQLGQTILDGRTDYTDDVTYAIHACMSCGACDISCKVCRYNLEPLEHNIELKHSAIENGKLLQNQKEIVGNLQLNKTMIRGSNKLDRVKWLGDLSAKVKNAFEEESDVIFFPGCKYSYDDNLNSYARKGLEILLDSGVKIGFLGEADMCCGSRAYQMGFKELFKKQKNDNKKVFELCKTKTIVTPCSDCYYAFKRLYTSLEIEVLHITEYICRLIDEKKITFKNTINKTVTYHDPCHLGRLGEKYIPWDGREKKIFNQIHTWEPKRPRYNGAHGIYDEPRKIINSIPGVQLREMERIREYSWCCGAGGGCSETTPEMSQWTASERITEAIASGAEILVTACPWCYSNMQGVKGEDGKSIEVMDIIDLIYSAM